MSRESIWDLSCETVREQLTNSIRKQWRILKSHVEKLDNQGKYRLNADRVSCDTQEADLESHVRAQTKVLSLAWQFEKQNSAYFQMCGLRKYALLSESLKKGHLIVHPFQVQKTVE